MSYTAAYSAIDKEEKNLTALAQKIWEHPETAYDEVNACEWIAEALKGYGFDVEVGYVGLPTAIKATWGKGHPIIGILGEYDALPGYGPNKDQNGHACGHNWIAACTFGAADVLAHLTEYFDGTIVYIGTPAEETVGGKIDLVNAGCFNDIDAVFQMHLTTGETQLNNRTLAMDSVEFTFEGVAAHAAGNPWKGVNALDAAYLTFTGINALRQHVTPDTRIHGIIEEGGVAPNIVPSHSVCKFYIRAASREYLNTLTEKIINCARGAELMTGAKMSWRFFENPYDDLRCNPELIELMAANLDTLGVPYNKELKAPGGSSDLGNVSHVCPTCYVSMDVGNTDGSACHEEPFLTHVNSGEAYDKNLKAVKAMAATALDYLTSEKIREAVKAAQ